MQSVRVIVTSVFFRQGVVGPPRESNICDRLRLTWACVTIGTYHRQATTYDEVERLIDTTCLTWESLGGFGLVVFGVGWF